MIGAVASVFRASIPEENKLATEFVAAQLRASVAPSVEWIVKGIDRSLELAGIFVWNGVKDLTKLSIERMNPRDALIYAFGYDYSGFEPSRVLWYDDNRVAVTEPVSWDDYIKEQGHVPYRFVYEGRYIGFLGDVGRGGGYGNTYKIFQWNSDLQVPLIAWSAAGDGNVSYCILSTPNGFGVVPYWQSSSIGDKLFFMQSLQMGFTFASFALAFGSGLNIAKEIGTKIIGAEMAASYPVAAIITGNTAINTALNGGDIEAAAKSAVVSAGAGQVGGIVGAEVASATDVQALGRVAAAATSTYIRGGNVDAAIAESLVMSAPSAFPSKPETPSMNLTMDNLYATPYGDVGLDLGDGGSVWIEEPSASFGSGGFFGAPVTMSGQGFNFGDELTGNAFASSGSAAGIVPLGQPSSFWDDTKRWFGDTFSRENIQTGLDIVKGGVQVVRTLKTLDDPARPPAPAPTTRTAPTVTQNMDGTFTVRNANGQTQVVTAQQLQAMQSGGGSMALGLGVAALAALAFLS